MSKTSSVTEAYGQIPCLDNLTDVTIELYILTAQNCLQAPLELVIYHHCLDEYDQREGQTQSEAYQPTVGLKKTNRNITNNINYTCLYKEIVNYFTMETMFALQN